jgi:hypothetical protein
MNHRDRKILTPVLSALRDVRRPDNPMDVRAVVAALNRAVTVSRTAAVVIENCGHGEYDLAREEAEALDD